jgi:hypothetical protein
MAESFEKLVNFKQKKEIVYVTFLLRYIQTLGHRKVVGQEER